ncbi:MAG TPA: TIR domain-containing protein [Thermoanaerobaculia bacterium]|jgi:hypothetical protein|nr:TIR domain-containing protein [Thermoanaerobaculia bacterium]
MQTTDLLVERFHRYFHHPDPFHDILTQGDHATACRNLRDALAYIDVSVHRWKTDTPELFDEELFETVQKFQRDYHHPIVDGKVGPNTRRRLIGELLTRHGPGIFARLRKDDADKTPSVFLSYAWDDSDKVDKVDQWLRNNGVRVLRDRDFFVAGMTIDENIRSAISRADKIVVFYSVNSKERNWPHLERTIAEEVERRLDKRILIYVRLDDSPLPAHDPTRLAVNAAGQPLRAVGEAILQALTGAGLSQRTIPIDENEPL